MKIYKRNILLFLSIIFCISNICYANTSTNEYHVTYDSISNEILELCNSYCDNSNIFRYGYKRGAFRKEVFPIEGKYEINCSTFTMLISLGISFENSRYVGNRNFCLFQDDYSQELLKWFSDSINIKFSRDIGKKMYLDGYCYTPKEDYSDLKTGDILFFNLDPTNDRPEIDFMGIDHSAIFGYEFGNRYVIYEVGDDKGPQKVLKSKVTMDKIVLVGRMPDRHTKYSNPITIECNHSAKNLNLMGAGKKNYNLAEIHLSTPLEKGHFYTLLVDVSLGNGIWLNSTYNNTSSYAFDMTDVKDYRPADGVYEIHFTAPDEIRTLYLNVRSNTIEDIVTDYNSCILYDGFVTKKVQN